ncbi:MAG TPA: hypothetical protein VF142_08950 [Longimicrobium sp.]
MKTLKLQPDALRVESYQTSRSAGAAIGTVHAHDGTVITRLGNPTCGGASCNYACITHFDDTCQYVCP